MRRAVVLALAAALAAGGLGALAEAQSKKKASVKILNRSDWTIDQFYLAAVDTSDWGPDQLGTRVIRKNEYFTITDIPCDSYDVKIVDEDADECVIEDVDICGGKETWEITSKDLLKCQGH